MNFYELWQIMREDGDLNAFGTMGDGLAPNTQFLNYDPDVTYEKGLNLKRRVWKKVRRGTRPVREGIEQNRDFVGYHCSKRDVSTVGDYGIISREYANIWFPTIIDSLYDQDRHELMGLGLYDAPEQQYDRWAGFIEQWLKQKGYRWVFVSHDKPYNGHRSRGASYGDNCYYVLLPDSSIIGAFNDPNEASASVYLYHKTKPPQFVVMI